MGLLGGQVSIITGAATGLGAAIARDRARQNAPTPRGDSDEAGC